MPERFNSMLRAVLLGSRWAMAPFCLGLIAALLIVLAQFGRELAHALVDFPGMRGAEVILAVLKLVDLVLVANLLLLIISAGIEIFLPSAAAADSDRPHAAGIAEFAALKPKLFASISAIAAIDLLESFINVESADKTALFWEITVLMVFVVAGVLLAWMDRLEGDGH
jgi:uncharacterized protein (TIGR00645 family)